MVVTGSLLHFVFDWGGRWPPLALIAAVNESIWEHLKLAFWPGLAWATVAAWAGGIAPVHLLAAKGLSLLVTAVLIVTVFKGYTAILGDNLLVLDIGTFVLAVLLGQILSAWLLITGAPRGGLRRAGLVLLGTQIVAYGLFTWWPPDLWLFIDSGTGLRGIGAR